MKPGITPSPHKEKGAEAAAAARSGLYALLARAFAFPEPELHHDLLSGRWLREAAEVASRLPYRLPLARIGSWRVPGKHNALQQEYIRLFEVGRRGSPPCTLYGGHYARDRMHAMEDLVRFYNFFGLRTARGHLPDHITVEMEFMAYLARREAEAKDDPTSYRRAQRDFLDRHLTGWLPQLALSLRQRRPLPFYRSLASLAARFVTADGAHLRALLAGGRC